MAQESRIEEVAGERAPRVVPVPAEPTAEPLPQEVVRREPETTEEARRAIEHARGRISATLDALEERIQEKRTELRGRLDVLRAAREAIRRRAWPSLGIAFGVGLLLSGVLRGDEGEHGEEEIGRAGKRTRARREHRILSPEERKALREWRAERRERVNQRLKQRMEKRAAARRGRMSLASDVLEPLVGAVTQGARERMRRKVGGY
ncbi:MAG TPA: hypothetical protein VKZ58_05460 [Longimicrobiales bacterium]|nr:hypothetical protein [Longimicrobiales bacterium]